MSGSQPRSRRDLLLGLRSALAPAPTPAPQASKLVAQIQTFSCLAARGQVCTVCAEHCPVPGAVQVDGLRVRIAEQVCTGCGTCREVCPAPENAIVLWPGAGATSAAGAGRP
jgi:Pyruvate/2-oxoacid:ferredoxin oxidoreductase delta subunit